MKQNIHSLIGDKNMFKNNIPLSLLFTNSN
jgi:hypothetical protein